MLEGRWYRPRVAWSIGLALSALFTLPLVSPALSQDWLRRPLADDAYFYLVIARNVAHGDGITYGGLPTSGFQPLYLVVCLIAGTLAGWHTIGVPMAVTLVNWLLYNAVGTWLIYRLWRRFHPESQNRAIALLAPLLWLASPQGQSAALNGMETTLSLLSWVVACSAICRYGLLPTDARASAYVGLSLGFAFLARNDSVVLAAGYVIASAVSVRVDASGGSKAALLWRAGRSLLITLLVALACAAPWVLRTGLESGSLIPQGGRAELAGGLYDFGRGYQLDRVIEAMARNLYLIPLPFGSLPATLRLPAEAVLLIVALVAILLVVRRSPVRFQQVSAFLGSSVLLLALTYALLFGAPHMAIRWLAPCIVLSVLVGAEGVHVVQRQWPQSIRLVAPAALAVVVAGRVGWVFVESSRASPTNTWGILQYVRTHEIRGPIGAFQAGLLSWILPEVINLDGKTNPEALAALRAGEFGQWLADSRVECVVDSNLLGTEKDPAIRSAFEVVRTPDGIVLLQRKHDGS